MAEGSGVLRRVVLPVVLLGLTALGLMNTYGDPSGVQELAGKTACGGEMCPIKLREMSRSAFAHEYVFLVGRAGTPVNVHCARAYIFLGDYACEKK